MENIVELIAAAEKQVGVIGLQRMSFNGKWYLYKAGPLNEDLSGATYDQAIAKLKEWATPPKPKTVTVTVEVPFEAAMYQAGFAPSTAGIKEFRDALKEAVKPWISPV